MDDIIMDIRDLSCELYKNFNSRSCVRNDRSVSRYAGGMPLFQFTLLYEKRQRRIHETDTGNQTAPLLSGQ